MFWNYAFKHRDKSEDGSTQAAIGKVAQWLRNEYAESWDFFGWRYQLPCFNTGRVFLYAFEQWLDGDDSKAGLEDDRTRPRKRLLLLELQATEEPTRKMLDGSGTPLMEIAKLAGGLRDSDAALHEYLTLFCAVMLGEGGNFVVANDARRLIFDPAKDARARFEHLLLTKQARWFGHAQTLDRPKDELTPSLQKINAVIDARGRPAPDAAPGAAPSVSAPDPWPAPEDYEDGFAIWTAPEPAHANGDSDPPAAKTQREFECVIFYDTAAFAARFQVDLEDGEVTMVDDRAVHDFGKTAKLRLAHRPGGSVYPFFADPAQVASTSAAEAIEELREHRTLRDKVVRSDLKVRAVADGCKGTTQGPLCIDNVLIEGDLDFDQLDLACGIVVRNCRVLGRLTAVGARVGGNYSVDDCEVLGLGPISDQQPARAPSIDLDRIRVKGSLDLTRVTAWGSVRAVQSVIDSHADLRGLWVLPAFEFVPGTERQRIRISHRDAHLWLSFEQAQIGGVVDLGVHMGLQYFGSRPDKGRATLVVGSATFREARIGQSLFINGLAVVGLRDELYEVAGGDGKKTDPSWNGLSLYAARIDGAVINTLTDTAARERLSSRRFEHLAPVRSVIGGELNMAFVRVGAAVQLDGIWIHADLSMQGSHCGYVSVQAFDAQWSERAKVLTLCELDPQLDLPDHRLNDKPEDLDAYLGGADWREDAGTTPQNVLQSPAARIGGDWALVNAEIAAGIRVAGACVKRTLRIAGGKIGGVVAQPWAEDAAFPRLWRPRFGALRAQDVEFTKRISLIGAWIEDAAVRGAARPPNVRLAPAFELSNCKVNGGVYFHDPSVYDGPPARTDSRWQNRYFGLKEGVVANPARLDAAKENREERRKEQGLPALVDVARGDPCATLFGGDVAIVNCELDGDLDFTNAVIDGCLRLTDSVVRADVCAVPFVDEPPDPGRWSRVALCTSLDFEALQCNGDVQLAGLRLPAGTIATHGMKVDGELRLYGSRLPTAGATYQGAPSLSGALEIDLGAARVARLVLPTRDHIASISKDWRLEGVAVERFVVETTHGADPGADGERDAVLRLLEGARFAPQAYLDFERRLVQGGRTLDADDVYRALQWREIKERPRPGSSLWALLYGYPLGFGTYFRRPFLLWLLTLFIALVAIWRPCDVEQSLDRLSAGPTEQRSAVDLAQGEQRPRDWGASERLWLALHYAVPIIELIEPSEWEASEEICAPGAAASPGASGSGCGSRLAGVVHQYLFVPLGLTPKEVTSIVRVLDWILLPVFFLGVVARLQRHRG